MIKSDNQSTKYELLNSAIELFKNYGYDNVTVDDISAAAGVTKPTFYYYFKSKDEIIIDFFADVNFFAKEHLASMLTAGNYIDQLWYINELYIKRTSIAGPAIAKELFIANLKNGSKSIAPDDIYLREVIITLINQGQECRQILNTTPAEKLYKTMVYLMDGVSLIWAMKDGNFDIVDESRKAFDELLLTNYS